MQLAIIPLFPLIAFAILAFIGPKLSTKRAQIIGVAGIGLSFVSAFSVLSFLFLGPKEFAAYREILWTWIPFYSSEVDTATIQMAFYLDSLSAVMLMVVTFISTLIAVFATSFMEDDTEVSWFFACMNLFVSFMLILVLGDNLLVLFLGWEGVGLCSYLLIGFWRSEIANGLAAMKAFVTTRVGDVFLLFAMFLIFASFGTLNIQEVLDLADANWPVGSRVAALTTLCLLIGAAGKSAQIPLQVWLADAMRGPTPVSALIHAATMVTAGVYLIARLGGLFALAPAVQSLVWIVGAATLIIAGICALLQNDMKRILAYSTMSQLGYMFLALGAGAYSAAVFHLATHACFKALLFLGAGAVGHVMHHEYSLLKVGNLRFKFPLLFWIFLIGLASLSALPFVTSGFYSKELILSQVLMSVGLTPWAIGAFGALLTGLYSARLFVLLFFKKPMHEIIPAGFIDWRMKLPLITLAVLSLVAGFLPIPAWVDRSVLALSTPPTHLLWPEFMAIALGMLGIAIGALYRYGLFVQSNVWMNNLGFDALYGRLLVMPYERISFFMKADPIRAVYRLVALVGGSIQHLLMLLQTGRVLHYVSALVVALILMLAYRMAL
ncbi:MAG: NADH-quinone oxidoreductase subunit L [Myxococcota bacterium]